MALEKPDLAPIKEMVALMEQHPELDVRMDIHFTVKPPIPKHLVDYALQTQLTEHDKHSFRHWLTARFKSLSRRRSHA